MSTARNEVDDRGTFVALVVLIFASFGILYHLIPREIFLVCALVGVGGAACSTIPLSLRNRRGERTSARIGLLALVAVVAVPLAVAVARASEGVFSLFSAVLVSALAIVFFYYSFVLPLVLLHLGRSDHVAPAEPPYPKISVLLPAYNEEGCVGASLDALRATDYPAEKKEIIVVDDGSTDGTYREAEEHVDETVTVLRKENGGKHSALNYGLSRASGEIVVTVDADSLLRRDGLKRVAGAFERDPEVGAVAGNVGVANRGSFVTNVQELEYVLGIQLFRRAFDVCETVTIVPGAFGAYRRSTLEEVGRFDDDTLTEDFDATIKVLKTGDATRANEARCLTEAPNTWRDLYRQRLRWYRGRTMTLLKHRDVFTSSRFGFLYSFAFPLELFSNVGLPVVGMMILVSIVVELAVGSVVQVVSLFLFFALLQVLVSVLAIRIGGDDPKLALYAPFFVLGYRQFLDLVMLKSVVDVLVGEELRWTGPERTGDLETALDRESFSD